MLRTRHLIIAPLLTAALSACASTSQNYPSLEIRDFERATGELGTPATEITDAASITPEALTELQSLEAQAAAAHQAFMAAAPSARQKVARAVGSTTTSNSWGDAQVALSDLDTKRSLTAIALGDLDLLYAEQAVALQANTEIATTRTRVIELIREQDVILAQLRQQTYQ